MASRHRGPLRAFRIADGRYPLFDGGGAAEIGGRWNSPGGGRRVIYGALSYAGAMLERLAQSGIGKIPPNQHWITIDIPDGVEIEEVTAEDVPDWDAHSLVASREYGDRWLSEKRSVALIIPSVIGRPHERNIAINQDHPEFEKLSASAPEPVLVDARLAPTRRPPRLR